MTRHATLLFVVLVALSTNVQAGPEQKIGKTCFAVYGGIDLEQREDRRSICIRELPRLMRAPMKQRLKWPKYTNGGWISNCSDYLSKVGYGRYWSSFSELPMEVPYMRTCGLLAVLADSNESKTVFKTLNQAMSMSVLPPTIVFPASTADAFDELRRLAAADISAEELITKEQWPRDTGVKIKVLAVADVNGDGVNDYIVERYYSCTDNCSDHSYHVGYLSPQLDRKVMQWIRLDDDERIQRLMPDPCANNANC